MRQTDDRFMAGMNGCVLDTVLIRTIGIRHMDAAILNDHFVVAFSVIDLNGTGLIQGISAVDLTANCDGDGCSGLMAEETVSHPPIRAITSKTPIRIKSFFLGMGNLQFFFCFLYYR